jgi:hypothetical protein
MNWLVFSYSLPPKSQSSPRVTLWRRLRRLGAISPKNSVHILPAREECIEAFQWLTQEVQQMQGEAIVMYVDRFEGLDDQQLIELFRAARSSDYTEILTQAETLETEMTTSAQIDQFPESLAKLRKRYTEIFRIDFFDTPVATDVAARLTKLEQMLDRSEQLVDSLPSCSIGDYQNTRWVTRPRPYIDRLACAWLIRRFINPNATIRYSLDPDPDEVAFDMKEGEFTHWGNLCSFETMLVKFALKEPGLKTLGEIIHELDLQDGLYLHPHTTGLETIVRGWLLMGLSDQELESKGVALFDGLYTSLARDKN